MATATLPKTKPAADIPEEQHFVLCGVDWDQYLEFERLFEGRHVRMTYDSGRLEFMTVSRLHELWKMILHWCILILAEELKVPCESNGLATFKRKSLKKGIEPDQGYYLTNEPLVRGKDELDLSVDPPPDLMIEIEVSRALGTRLRILATLGVPEVWCYNGQRVRILQLRGKQYVEEPRSLYFPSIPIQEIHSFIERRGEMDQLSLMAQFREWVRRQIAAP
jgi:Uma2 family endonuclease